MIFEEYGCLHVHIPKTAGKSIEQALGGVEPRPGSADHRTVADYVREIGTTRFGEYYSFAFVRNPWDKVVSTYEARRQILKKEILRRLSFRDWVLRRDQWLLTSYQLQYLTIDHKIAVSFVGRFETLERDWQKICHRLRRDVRLPHLNRSYHKHYTQYYDDETRGIVAEVLRTDVEFFGYEFGEQ